MKSFLLLFALLFFIGIKPLFSQSISNSERIGLLSLKLDSLSAKEAVGLSKKIQFAVSGVPLKEFIEGIAETAELNVSIDPSVEGYVYNNFSNETAKNILVFLCDQYQLDIKLSGSIISFFKYVPEQLAYVPKAIKLEYNPYNDLLTIDLKNDTLEQVARTITSLTGKNIVLAPGLGNQLINSFIQRMPFNDALDKIAFSNNLHVTLTKDNFYLLELTDHNSNFNQSPSRSVGFSEGKIQNKRTGKLNLVIEKDTTLGLVVSTDLENTSLSEVVKEVFQITGINYYLFSELKGLVTLKLSRLPLKSFLSHLLSGTEYTFKEQGNVYLVGERNIEGLRDSHMLQLKYRSADAIIDVIPNEIKKGVEIKLFKELNTLLLSGSAPQILEIKQFVNHLDKTVPMVLIEVILVDIRKGYTIETGINAGISDSIASGGTLFPELNYNFSSNSINRILTNLNSTGVLNLGRVTPNFYVTLKALERNEDINIRSTPKLATLNGHEASLTIGEKIYYVQQTQNVIAANNPQTTILQQFQQTSADTKITIDPIISADDQVTLLISAEFSEFIPSSSAAVPPGNATRSFKSMIRVRNEEMVVLGGLEQESRSRSGRGVPILSRIPILKWLFSSRSDSKRKSRLIIFIKPTIVY